MSVDRKSNESRDRSDSLGKDPKTLDIGELICMPILRVIPNSVTPNQISGLNHVLNYVLLYCAFHSYDEDSFSWRSTMMGLCAIINFVCMALDCLDGMHARKSGQCSKLGELLDHAGDAIHVPFVAGGVVIALRAENWGFAISVVMNFLIYNAQLVVMHQEGAFTPTSGVEAQIMTSVLYLGCIGLAELSLDSQLTVWIIRAIVLGSVFVMLQLIVPFFKRMNSATTKRFVATFVFSFFFIFVYLRYGGSRLAFLVFVTYWSTSINGEYVLSHVLREEFIPSFSMTYAATALICLTTWADETGRSQYLLDKIPAGVSDFVEINGSRDIVFFALAYFFFWKIVFKCREYYGRLVGKDNGNKPVAESPFRIHSD